MANIINGDNGSVSGTAGLKSSSDGTGILALQTNGTTAVTVDASQNVGIGTASPSYKLDVRSSLAVLDGSANIGFWANGSSYTQVWQTFQSPNDLLIKTTAAKYIAFLPDSTERMRIDTSGNLLVGLTSGAGERLSVVAPSGNAAMSVQVSANGNAGVNFKNVSSTTVGQIVVNAATTAYNTSSDYRLKNTIAPMTGALAKVQALKPVTYKWNIDDEAGEGFIAHELAEVCPHAVTGEKDAIETYTDEDGNEQTRLKYQGIDTSFLVATLTAAIQEQQALITALTARITALEAK
jgi:hypothetical protein